MNAICWLILMLVLIGIEIATLGLTTIWFAGGALGAFIAAAAGGDFPVQLIVFFVISLVLLFATRPIAVKYLNRGRTKTNADSLVGRKAVVTKDIDNLKSEGEAEVSGQIWTARSEDEDVKIPAGAVVEILRISGVKLIVRDAAVKEHTEEQIQ